MIVRPVPPPPAICRDHTAEEGRRAVGQGTAGALLAAASRRTTAALGDSFAWANRERHASLSVERDGAEPVDLVGSVADDPPVLPFREGFTVRTRFVEAGRLEPIPPDAEDVAFAAFAESLPEGGDW